MQWAKTQCWCANWVVLVLFQLTSCFWTGTAQSDKAMCTLLLVWKQRKQAEQRRRIAQVFLGKNIEMPMSASNSVVDNNGTAGEQLDAFLILMQIFLVNALSKQDMVLKINYFMHLHVWLWQNWGFKRLLHANKERTSFCCKFSRVSLLGLSDFLPNLWGYTALIFLSTN